MALSPPDSPRTIPAGLLPHSGAARLITEIVRSEPGFVEAIGRVPSSHPLVVAGKAPCFLGIELGAQAAAAMEALDRGSSAAPVTRIGYLVRIREATFVEAHLPANTPLLVKARLEGAATPLAMHRIGICVGGTELLTAVISTFSKPR